MNGVAVGEQTYRATSRVFEYEPLAPVSVKGKAEPLALWRAKAARARFGTDISRQYTTPLVGRELEKPLLIGTFERAAQQRSVQLVTVVGEPGVGKSRLVAELFAYLEAKPELTRWRQGRCLPYGEGITFWALGEIVKAEAGILESDSAEVAAAKLEAAVSPEEPERQWLLQRLGPLVGVEAASPAERQELFTAWRRFLEGLAAARPSVLVFEDLHWADEALLEFLEHLAEWSEGVPLLVLCTARPELYERRPGWGAGQRNAHTINLPPLSDQETAELVSHLITTTVLSAELEQAVLERAGGNPLYAEEFVRLLADRGLAADETELPESVQALIAARLDTLSPERKSLLQDAAVLGRCSGRAPWPRSAAATRASSSWRCTSLPARSSSAPPGRARWRARASTPSGTCSCATSPTARSRGRSGRAVTARRPPGSSARRASGSRTWPRCSPTTTCRRSSSPRPPATRSRRSELAQPARRFLALAGERALGLDTAQAEARLARALELSPADDPERPELLVRWADAAFQAGRPREAAEALDEALAALRARGETEAAARALQLRSRVALARLGEGRQVALAAEAVALLEPETPGPALVAAYAQLARRHFLAGAYAEAIAAAERAATLAETLGLPEPARALGFRGFARVSSAIRTASPRWSGRSPCSSSRARARTPPPCRTTSPSPATRSEGPARSLAAFEQGIAFCEQRGLAEAMAAALEANCPGLLVELGRPEEALERAGRLAAAAEASGDTHLLIELRSVELATRLARGERQASPAGADWLIETARESGTVDSNVLALASAASALGRRRPSRRAPCSPSSSKTPGARETPYYARQLAAMLRTALAAGDPELAKRLADGLEPRYPLDEHALCAARAQLAEHAGDHADAATLYAEAAARWQEFGNVPERAHALLGQGRCLFPPRNPPHRPHHAAGGRSSLGGCAPPPPRQGSRSDRRGATTRATSRGSSAPGSRPSGAPSRRAPSASPEWQ